MIGCRLGSFAATLLSAFVPEVSVVWVAVYNKRIVSVLSLLTVA
jgi:hypothetical protein